MSQLFIWGAGSFTHLALGMMKKTAREVPIYAPPGFAIHPALASDCIVDEGKARYALARAETFLVCVGSEHGLARTATGKLLKEKTALTPHALIHHRAFIEETANYGFGLCMMAQAYIGMFTQIGEFVIVNTNASIDHECILGNGVHVMGSAAVAGRVTLKDYVTVGTNATILPDLTMGEGAIIGAGSVVTRDVEPWTIVTGAPARPVGTHVPKFAQSAIDQIVSALGET